MLLKGKVGVAPAFLQLGMSSDEEEEHQRSKVVSRRSSGSSRYFIGTSEICCGMKEPLLIIGVFFSHIDIFAAIIVNLKIIQLQVVNLMQMEGVWTD